MMMVPYARFDCVNYRVIIEHYGVDMLSIEPQKRVVFGLFRIDASRHVR